MWIWPQVASCDLRLQVGLHFRGNERLGHLWHSEQKKHLTSVATTGQDNYGMQNRSNVEQKQQNTDHTRPESNGQGQEKKRKEDSGLLIYIQNGPEMLSEQLPRCFEGP